MILQLNASQVLLNKLYIPISKGNIATMVKSKEAKEFTKYVHIECIRQKIKPSPVVVANTLNPAVVNPVVKERAAIVKDSLKVE